LKPIAIIGAGITGLTAAFYLKRKGCPVVVYEAGSRAGGVIQSLRKDGYLAEFGPNTLLETSPAITALVRDAGLQARRLDPDPGASNRYVVRYRRPIAMPESPLGFFASDLFSVRAKLALLREPFVPRRRDGAEESIAEFVTRRLGREFLEQAIDALVAGVYAGDPARLSVPQAFPKLAEIERRYGSLILGQILGARARRKRGEVAKDRAPKFSFDEGLQVLPDTLRKDLGDAVHFRADVARLVEAVDGWRVEVHEAGHEVLREHSAVLYAGTAFRLAQLQVESAARLDLPAFSEIRYPPVASVVLGFRREDVAHPLDGFGMLIPRVEGFKILGTIFSSSLFPNRAPAGCVVVTSYVGGERFPDLASLPADQLYEMVQADLKVLLGVKGSPTFRHSVFYPRAIPQYNVGYGRFRDQMTQIENKAPRLFLAGHYRDGVSLSDSIVSGVRVADRIVEWLSTKSGAGKAVAPMSAAGGSESPQKSVLAH
jgi:oxygen-dependent protoporphyrinogen oxidase